jgi:hypothetical protein
MHHFLSKVLAIAALSILIGCAVNISAALGPQPEPPDIYSIGMNTAKGLFSGQIVYPYLRPEPEPPIPIIGADIAGGLFSGEIVSIA